MESEVSNWIGRKMGLDATTDHLRQPGQLALGRRKVETERLLCTLKAESERRVAWFFRQSLSQM